MITTRTSIDTAEVADHLTKSTTIGDELEARINTINTLEARVIAGSAIGPDPVTDDLAAVVEMWRTHDGLLQTILDSLATFTGGTPGLVTVPTEDLRNEVAAANGPINGGSYEIRDDGLDIIVDGQRNDDTITVTQNADGSTTVVINGNTVDFTEEESQHLLILGGDGDDTITVNPYRQPVLPTPGGPVTMGAPVRGFRIDGGADNDTIIGGTGDDNISGGEGRDYIDGGRGDDRLAGDDGFDTIYGGRGEDTIIGGAGNDYLDGGRGDDLVTGRAGNDVVAGGDGDDLLFGGSDDDVIIGGRGVDAVYDSGDGDTDRVFAQAEDEVQVDAANAANLEIFEVYDPDSTLIRTSGTIEERDRIQSDLDTLAAIPEGAAVLQSIDENAGGHTVTIGIGTGGSGATAASGDGTYEVGGVNGNDSDGTPNSDVGQGGTISYNPTTTRLYDRRPDEDWHDTPPVVILHHELLHTEDYVHGSRDPGRSQQVEHDFNGNAVPGPRGTPPPVMTQPDGTPIGPVNNRELSVVGLPFDEDDRLNIDPVSGGGEVDSNDRLHTENSLRVQLGLPLRRYY